MKAITKFVADDGSEFSTEVEARRHELLCAEIAAIMGQLLPRPSADGCSFENGGLGFLQQEPATFASVRVALLRLAQRYTSHHWIQQAIDGGDRIHPSWPGRMMDESCPQPLNRAWWRVMCTDTQAREWGQPYFREHPEEAAA